MSDYFYKRPQGQPLDDDDLVFVLCVADIRQQLSERLDRPGTEEELVAACHSVDQNFDWADSVDVCCDVAMDSLKEDTMLPVTEAQVVPEDAFHQSDE